MYNPSGKSALITGGSSGIGLSMAKLLAKLGANIWIMGRDQEKLDSACNEIVKQQLSPEQQIKTIAADVAKYNEISSALLPFIEQPPDLVINSAGITYPGYFYDLDLQIFRDMMEVNYFGTLYVLKLLIPGMMKRKSGMIINISSAVGLHGLIGYSAYAASKFAVVGLSDALRYDVKPYDIQVSVAIPTDTDTPQLAFEKSLKPDVLRELTDSKNTPMPPDLVAGNILQSAFKGKYLILPTGDARILYAISRLFPGNSFYKVVDFWISQARHKVAKENGGH